MRSSERHTRNLLENVLNSIPTVQERLWTPHGGISWKTLYGGISGRPFGKSWGAHVAKTMDHRGEVAFTGSSREWHHRAAGCMAFPWAPSPSTTLLSWAVSKGLAGGQGEDMSFDKGLWYAMCLWIRSQSLENRGDNRATIHLCVPAGLAWREGWTLHSVTTLHIPTHHCPNHCPNEVSKTGTQKTFNWLTIRVIISDSLYVLRAALSPLPQIHMLKWQLWAPQGIFIYGDKVFKEAIKLKWGCLGVPRPMGLVPS